MTVPAARRASVLAAFVIALAVPVVGAAAPARAALPLTLTWEAPTGCPTAADLRAEVERLVRFPPGQAPPPLAADGHVETREGRWRLRLRTERDGLPGERELEADSCASLAHAATLVLALAFGVGAPEAAPPPPPVDERPARPAPRPRAVESPPPPPAAPPPPVEAPPPPVVPPPPSAPVVVVASAPPPRAPTEWALTAQTRVSRGPLPDLGWGAGIGLDATTGRFLTALRFDAWLPTDDLVAGTPARMRFSGVGGTLSICALAVRHPRFALAGCALGGGAALTGSSTGGLTGKSLTAPWYSAGVGVRARVRLVRALHAEAGLEAEGSLTRPVYKLDGRGEIYTVPALVPAATLGLSLDL